jgi:hypothetical protein
VRRRSLSAGAAFLIALCTVVIAVAAHAGAEPGFSALQAMPPPVGGPSPPVAPYAAISCPTTSQCTAVGTTAYEPGQGKPTVVTDRGGVWGAPRLVAVPAGGTYGGHPPAQLTSISCADANHCTAVGWYRTSTGSQLPMTAEELGGVWTSRTGAIPADGLTGSRESAGLTAVECLAARTCVAVGGYEGSDRLVHAMVLVESAGTWGAPTELPDLAALSLFLQAQPDAIGCSDTKDCIVLSATDDLAATQIVTHSWTETAGTWSAPTQVNGPRFTSFAALGIACPSTSTCLAVGASGDPGLVHPEVAVAIDGTWGAARVVGLPFLSPRTRWGQLRGISCRGPTLCEAVGGFGPATSGGGEIAGALSWSSGVWSAIGFVPGVRAGARSSSASTLLGLSCPSMARCTAIGAATDLHDAANYPATYPFSVELTPVRPLTAPRAPSDVVTRGTLGGAIVRWSPPPDDGGAPVSSFTAWASPSGRSCRSPSVVCEIHGLRNGHRYRISVTVTTSFGTSATSARALVVAGAVPAPPSGVRVLGATAMVTVTWGTARTPPGEPVLGYLVTIRGAATARRCTTIAHACRFGGLSRGATYVASVVARDASGDSLPSATVRATTR